MNHNNLSQKNCNRSLEDSMDSWCDFSSHKKELNFHTKCKLLNAPKSTKKIRLNLNQEAYDMKPFFLAKNELTDESVSEESFSEDNGYHIGKEGAIPSCNISIDPHSKNDLQLSNSDFTFVKSSNFGPWRNKDNSDRV